MISSIQEEESLEQSSSLGFSEPSVIFSEGSSKGSDHKTSPIPPAVPKPVFKSPSPALSLTNVEIEKHQKKLLIPINETKEKPSSEEHKNVPLVNFLESETCIFLNGCHSSLLCNSTCFKSVQNLSSGFSELDCVS